MVEIALTGSDILVEIIPSNDRLQGGIRVADGGIIQSSSSSSNNLPIPGQPVIDRMSDRLEKSAAQRYG